MFEQTRLASEARVAGRYIFASLPHEVRIATALRYLTRLAFSAGDARSLGLVVLHAMVQAGVQGRVFETPMAEVANLLKKKGTALTRMADAFGKAILSNGLRGYDKPRLEEKAISNVIERIMSDNPIQRGLDVPQVVNYLSNMVRSQASTISKLHDFKTKVVDLADVDEFMSNPRSWTQLPGRDLMKIVKDIERDPRLQDENGEPRMARYVEGLAQGMSLRTIAQSMGFHDHKALANWVASPLRMKVLRGHLEPLLG